MIGPSGTGKSAFLRAGLIPRLQRADRHFVVLDILRPKPEAITGTHGLAASVHNTRTRLGLPGPALGDIKAALKRDNSPYLSGLLTEIIQAAHHRLLDPDAAFPTLVLAIDQAEELLTTDSNGQNVHLLDLLADVLTATE